MMICERLDFDHVPYTLATYKDMEFVTAYQIKNSMKRYDNEVDYESYVFKLESMGIDKARDKMENWMD